MSPELSEDDELLAAELAFGLIDGAERTAAESRVDSDATFAQAHSRWQTYAAALFTSPGEAPRPSVWGAIEARLPANDVVPIASPQSLRWWKMSTLAASAAAVVMGVVAMKKPETVFVRVPVAQVQTAPMVAVLSGQKGIVTISFDRASGRMTSAVSDLNIGKHSPELWVIPADGKPRSIGVLSSSVPTWMKVRTLASSSLTAGVTIAVSIEPIGGSPTGQPTGPVILTGKLKTI